MPFLNRIRLPFHLSRPQFPADEEIYVKTNGSRVVLKSIISKELQGETYYFPSKIHERLTVALRHDTVNIESDKYTGSVKMVGGYEIGWIEFLDYPVAKATFKVFEEDFVARSNRCEVCTELNFLNLQDDYIEEFMDEGSVNVINVAANDSVCCASPVFSIFTYDTNYIASISISQAGVVTMTLKTPVASVTNKDLFTYKVTCGELEESAVVSGNILGSLSAPCPAPSNLVLTEVDPSSNPVEINAAWTASAPPPADGYGWTLHSWDGATETLISFGNTAATTININSLTCGVVYRFRVKAICDAEAPDESATLLEEITVACPPAGENMYLVNESGVQVDIESDGNPYSFTPPINGNVVIYPSTNFTNQSGITLKFRFLSSMPDTLITEQILADGASYAFPADVSLYNYVRVTIP